MRRALAVKDARCRAMLVGGWIIEGARARPCKRSRNRSRFAGNTLSLDVFRGGAFLAGAFPRAYSVHGPDPPDFGGLTPSLWASFWRTCRRAFRWDGDDRWGNSCWVLGVLCRVGSCVEKCSKETRSHPWTDSKIETTRF